MGIEFEWRLQECWEKSSCTYLFYTGPYFEGLARNLVSLAIFCLVAHFALRRGNADNDSWREDTNEATCLDTDRSSRNLKDQITSAAQARIGRVPLPSQART